MLITYLEMTLLVSVRLLPVLVAMPVLAFARVPGYVRLILALALAGVIASGIPAQSQLDLTAGLLMGEFLVGMVYAFGFHAAHGAVDFVGRLIDTQVGLNAVGVFDPSSGNTTGILAEILTLTLALLFVVLDVHHGLLRAFSALVAAVPPGRMDASILVVSGSVLSKQFLLAFLVTAPVIFGLWLVDVAFAIMSRSMPQANVYFLALPVKLAMGIALLVVAAPVIVAKMPQLFDVALGAPVIGVRP